MRDSNNLGNSQDFGSTNQKISFLAGRPKRKNVINDGDIANLKIALNTAKTLEDFFKSV